MLDVGIDIQGLKTMEKALLEIAKEVGEKKAAGMFTSALRAGAVKFKDSMTRNVTESNITRIVKTKRGGKVEIRPGFLKSRIKVRASTSKGFTTKKFGENVVSLVQVGVFKVPYIVHYEYGTSGHSANPIIRNAFTKRTKQSVVVINHQLAKRIKLAQKRIAKKYKTS